MSEEATLLERSPSRDAGTVHLLLELKESHRSETASNVDLLMGLEERHRLKTEGEHHPLMSPICNNSVAEIYMTEATSKL